MRQGLCCGNPLPDDRIIQAMAHGVTLFRTNAAPSTQISQDQFRKFGVTPLWVIGVYNHTVEGVQRTIAEVRKFPDGSLIEFGNEPNIGDAPAGMPRLSPWDYAAIAGDCRAEIEQRGMTCYYGAVSSLDTGGQAWLSLMLGYAPWITHVSVHRYPYTNDQDPAQSAYGSRTTEMAALLKVTGDRRVLVSETGIRCPPVSEAQQLAYLRQEVAYWRDVPTCDGVVVYVEGGAPEIVYGLREGTDGRWRAAGEVFRSEPGSVRAIAVITCNAAGARVVGAAVHLHVSADPDQWLSGWTDAEGYVEFPEVDGGLTASHLRVTAEGYVPVDTHIDLTANINQQIWIGPGAEQPTAVRLPALVPAKLVPDHNPRKVQCNFGSLWDPVLNRWIFQNMYPSMGADTRARWRQIAAAAGDTHFQIGNPTTPHEDYHIPDYTNWLTSGRMDHWVACARELADDGFTLIAYADSGDAYPGAGYHRRFFEAVPADLRAQMIGVPGHEIIPGGYTTKQGDDAVQEIAAAGVPLIAMHTGDDRLSWSSHPLEADDPFHGDEMACYHGTSGHLLTHHFCQLRLSRADDPLVDTDEASVVCEAHGISSRADGSGWVDPNGKAAPDWQMSWIEPVLWETDEELVFRGQRTRAQILAVARACLKVGFSGYGCGEPDMVKG